MMWLRQILFKDTWTFGFSNPIIPVILINYIVDSMDATMPDLLQMTIIIK